MCAYRVKDMFQSHIRFLRLSYMANASLFYAPPIRKLSILALEVMFVRSLAVVPYCVRFIALCSSL